ncbi:tetratricopeptide repeat protein [Chryseolinea sp. T2]|uniref:tetratricopeptide repeat protein n=1 Tax=Chryseolinea sp. T2 TaxID=3129255 RepID=UPI0030777779
MPPTVAGHQYDIFISYRHKDNKYDGWVTEFVNNLRNELEATFKRDLSIYFDQNQHDGIHETNDVADSLRDKIRCLVFIPILSRTYCDPESFAWKHELLAFRDHALSDEFGLKVKLKNGNVTSRILPIRIHELDQSDRNLFEAETKGVLRPVDFIYTSSGVNRPLRSHEDEPRENQSHTFYRDQINKVAICIRDIVNSTTVSQSEANSRRREVKDERSEVNRDDRKDDIAEGIDHPKQKARVSNLTKVSIVAGAILLLALAYFVYSRSQASSAAVAATFGSAPSSIAVLPFVNISNDPEQEYFSDGVTVQIITDLSQLRDLKVIARASVMKYKKTSKSIAEIGKELNVTHVLEGSVRKSGEKLRVTAELISVSDESHLWSEDYNTNLSDIFSVQDEVSLKIAKSLRHHLQNEDQPRMLARPSNPKAYEHYLKGLFIHDSRYQLSHRLPDFLEAESEFSKAIELDPKYAIAYAALADLYDTHSWWASDRANYLKLRDSLATISYRLDPKSFYSLLVKAFTFTNNYVQNELREQPDSIFKYMLMAYQRSPNDNTVTEELSLFMRRHGLFDKALELAELSITLDPLSSNGHNLVGGFHFGNGNLAKAEVYLQKALALEPDNVNALADFAGVKIVSGDFKAADQFIDRIRPLNPYRADVMHAYRLAASGQKDALNLRRDEITYTLLEMNDEAIDYLKKNPKDYLYLKNHPVLTKLRSDSRLQPVLATAREVYEQSLKRFSFSNAQ